MRLAETASPNTKNRSHRIEVRVVEPGDGVLVAIGGLGAGWSLYVRGSRPTYHHNWFDRERTSITSPVPLPDGPSTVTFDFVHDGGGPGLGGEGVLSIDGVEVGRERIDRTVVARFGIDTFGVGADTGSPVTNDNRPPFAFEGRIERVDIHLGDPGLDPEQERVLHARFRAGKEY